MKLSQLVTQIARVSKKRIGGLTWYYLLGKSHPRAMTWSTGYAISLKIVLWTASFTCLFWLRCLQWLPFACTLLLWLLQAPHIKSKVMKWYYNLSENWPGAQALLKGYAVSLKKTCGIWFSSQFFSFFSSRWWWRACYTPPNSWLYKSNC